MFGFHMPPSGLRLCLGVVLLYMILGVLYPVFFLLSLVSLVLTIFNSIWMFREQQRFRERGILRYMSGEWKDGQGEYE